MLCLRLLLVFLCGVARGDLASELQLFNGVIYPGLDDTVTVSEYNCSSAPTVVCCVGSPGLCTLNFENYNLSGTISSRIGELTRLITLHLEKNINLHGALPAMPSTLRYLYVDGCALNGSMPMLPPILVKFDGHNNEFSAMPASLPTALTEFYVHFQRDTLTGTIPPLANTKLNVFNVGGNTALSGTIPPFPTTLDRFYCYQTNISGGLPPLHEGLTDLHCSNAPLACTLPPTLPSTLKSLDLDQTDCYGTVPAVLPDALYLMSLANNGFSGTLPSTIPEGLNALWLDGNELHGSVSYPNHTFIMLSVERNRLSGYFEANALSMCGVLYVQNASLEGNCFTCPSSFFTSLCFVCAGNTSLIGDCVPYTPPPTASPTPPPTTTPTRAPSPAPTTLAPTASPTTTAAATTTSLLKKGDAEGQATTLIIVGAVVGFFCISLLVIGLVALLLRNLRAERRRRRKPASTSASDKQSAGASASSTVFASGRVSSRAASRNRSHRASRHLSAAAPAAAAVTNYGLLNPPLSSQYRPLVSVHAYENGPMLLNDHNKYDVMSTTSSAESAEPARPSGYGMPPEEEADDDNAQIFSYGKI